MAKIYEGNVVLIRLDCKEDVDSQLDLWIIYEKPESHAIERWPAIGIGDFATYTTIKDVDLDEHGGWELQPWSDTHDVHGDIRTMPVFPPLIPFKKAKTEAYLVGV